MKTSELNRHIASSEELEEYLMQKAVKHNYYKHYALYDRIIRIKQDKNFIWDAEKTGMTVQIEIISILTHMKPEIMESVFLLQEKKV